MADSNTRRAEEISTMLNSAKTQETSPEKMSEMVRLGLEASRIATAKMVDFYRRMDIEVTPQMTMAKPSIKLEQSTSD